MLSNVLRNFGSLTTMRVLSRLLHFILKTYLIRTQLNEQILAHLLNLDLILTTSLHVIRSCFKPSYQKVSDSLHLLKSSMNIMTFGIAATALSALAIGFLEYYHFLLSEKTLLYFTQTIVLYGLSAVCEAVAEKYMVECVIKYEYLKIGGFQVVSVLPKTIYIFVAAGMRLFDTQGILIFGIGQLLYSSTLMLLFFLNSPNKTLLLQPFPINSQQVYFDPHSKSSLKSFSILSFLKLILQQFQRIVLVIMDISHVSSTYSLISNLGSVIVRYLFSPLNEIIYNYFSRGDATESVLALVTFVKFILVFSIMVVSFGYNYSEIFLLFLYGEKWVTQESIAAMRMYMALIIFLGFNGVIEAFLFARGKESISRYNFLSIATTALYLAATIGFLQLGLGASGLFLGNIVNMSLRIVVCWHIEISHHISLRALLQQILPTSYFLLTSLLLFLASHKHYGFAQTLSPHNLLNFLLGAALFCLNLLPLLFEHRAALIHHLKSRLSPQQPAKQE